MCHPLMKAVRSVLRNLGNGSYLVHPSSDIDLLVREHRAGPKVKHAMLSKGRAKLQRGQAEKISNFVLRDEALGKEPAQTIDGELLCEGGWDVFVPDNSWVGVLRMAPSCSKAGGSDGRAARLDGAQMGGNEKNNVTAALAGCKQPEA